MTHAALAQTRCCVFWTENSPLLGHFISALCCVLSCDHHYRLNEHACIIHFNFSLSRSRSNWIFFFWSKFFLCLFHVFAHAFSQQRNKCDSSKKKKKKNKLMKKKTHSEKKILLRHFSYHLPINIRILCVICLPTINYLPNVTTFSRFGIEQQTKKSCTRSSVSVQSGKKKLQPWINDFLAPERRFAFFISSRKIVFMPIANLNCK